VGRRLTFICGIHILRSMMHVFLPQVFRISQKRSLKILVSCILFPLFCDNRFGGAVSFRFHSLRFDRPELAPYLIGQAPQNGIRSRIFSSAVPANHYP
jgi:hypothetical protein